MKHKLLITILTACGFAGAASTHAQTRFIDVAKLGDGAEVATSQGTVKVNATVLTKNQTWTRDRVYILANNVIVSNGVTLRIEPGTLIRAEYPTVGQGVGAEAALTPADPGALVIARGGSVIAAGTADAPIIFTSMDDPNVPGGEATIPPYENLESTNASSSTNTLISVTNRIVTLTNTSTSFSNAVVFYGIAGSTSSSFGSPTKSTNWIPAKSTNTGATNELFSFTNYGFQSGTNIVWSVTRPDGVNWFNWPTNKSVTTVNAAKRVFRSGYQITANAAGDYTLTTPGTMSYNATTGARSYANAWQVTNASAFQHDGLWGGIVIAGKGTVNRGYNAATGSNTLTNANTSVITQPSFDPTTGEVTGTQRGVQAIEGMAGFPDFAWGGGDVVGVGSGSEVNDSGILRFISNRYGGFIIATDVELNSYSFYGVGRNTTCEFLEAWNNADDDFELWGGDVNLRWVLSLFCGDDGLDTDQGYLGCVQYLVQIQNNGIGTNGVSVSGRSTSNYGDSLTENDGPESNNSAVPYSTYTLANGTLIGRGYGSASYSSGPFAGPNFKDNAGAHFYNTIIMDNPHGAVMITDRVANEADNTFSAAGNSSINRFATNRSSGGFDAADRGNDLVTADTGAAALPDGYFKNVWFYRNGYADSSAQGVEGVYTNQAAFSNAVVSNNISAAGLTNMFPKYHDRNGRGASANGDRNRANTQAVIDKLTNSSNFNVFNQNPGIQVNPYHRLSGLDLRVTNSSAKNLGTNGVVPSYRGLNADATFVGAVRDNMWMRGWTLSDVLGIYSGSAIVPEFILSVEGSTPVITFTSDAGVKYVLEKSNDNKTYTKVATIEAVAGSNVYRDTLTTVGGTPKFYRLIAL
jgi:hypothetical protein